jgi:acetyl esterase/lipase
MGDTVIDRLLPWLGAGVVAAGVSAAAIGGAGLAVADDGSAGGVGAGNTSSDSPKSGDGKDDSSNKSPTDSKPKDDTTDDSGVGSDDPKNEQATGEDKDGERTRGQKKRARVQEGRTTARPPATQVEATSTKVDEQSDVETSDPVDNQDPVTEDVTVAVTPTPVSETAVEAVSTPKPSKPNVVDRIATAVSSVVTTFLSPFGASTTPEAPAAQPQLWTLAAAARRELETGAVSSSLAEEVAPVENSLTYTPPPTFQDRLTLMIHETFSLISKITGVSVHAVLGRVLASGTPPFFLTFGLDTQRTVYTAEDGAHWQVWEFHPPDPTGKTVVAFHGGGFIYQPNILNWIDYTNMARQTGATVIVPLYPLATTEAGRATAVIPEAVDFISHQIDVNGAENVSLYADSAGTVIAISAVRQLLLAGKPVPSSMVLLSTVADSTLSNPDIRNVDDPIFDVNNVTNVWESHWYDGITDLRDPLVSPLFFEPEVLKALPPTTIYVGEREILYPDTLLLHQRAVDEGAPISVVVGTGLIHDWPASGSPLLGFSQTAAVRPDVYRQLGLTGDGAASLSATEMQAPEAISNSAVTAQGLTPGQPTLFNIVGSFAFGIFQAVENFIVGPPQVPPGSTVRVQRSTLEIDCGPGFTVDSDWYFPDTEEPPTRLIYFQHGFPGSAAEYDYTAAELAERNNAIVVATTIPATSSTATDANLAAIQCMPRWPSCSSGTARTFSPARRRRASKGTHCRSASCSWATRAAGSLRASQRATTRNSHPTMRTTTSRA